MMWPLTSFAVRQPAISSIRSRQRSAIVAASPRLGVAQRARRSASSFSMVPRIWIFSAAFCSTASGESPVRAARSAAKVAAKERATSISRSKISSRRRRASWSMGLLQTALELQQFIGDPAGVDLVGAGMDGLFHRRYFGCVDHRRFGDGLFDLLQRTGGVGQGDGIAGL